MQYNYSFEIAATIFMLLILSIHLLNPNFELAKSRAFFSFLVACIFESIFNIASSWGLANTDFVSNRANQWICFFFFLGEAFASVLSFRYIVKICETSKKRRILYSAISFAPFAIFICLIVSNGFTHFLYSIEDNKYSQGPLAWYGYLYIAFFIVASFMVSLTSKKTIRGRNRYAVLLAATISLMTIIVQYEIKYILFTGFANAIVLCMFYILIQNPNELNDKNSGVKNTRAFFLRFENGMNLEKRMKVLTFDIHQPAQLNVLYGYRTGNAIIAEVADYIASLVGVKNTYQISAHVFATILETDEEVERIRSQVENRFTKSWIVDKLEIRLPVKTAVIKYPEDVSSVKDFYGLQFFVKGLQRKQVLMTHLEVTEEIKKQYLRISEVDIALKRALEEKSLQVYFQPIYSEKKKHFSSLEALARLFDRDLGFIPPDEFIARAENSGLVIPLDLMILEKTCEFIYKQILPNNDRLGIENIHVNVSALQCMQPNMDEAVLSIIDSYGIPRSMIVLEITERATVTAAELMEKHMKNLKEKGIRFALDDYGTGNSNCSYLINYPFDEVKFDKNMVWSYFSSETGKVILEGEMKTIHKLNIPIVAEGIETGEQLKAMNDLDVEAIQGYYFSKPLSGDDTMDFLFRQDIGTI